jgi:hypothetical protein
VNGYVLLGIAIAFEVFSTSMQLIPSLAFIIGMGTSFIQFRKL